MAQQTSELWDRLWETKNTEREYKFDINGTEYTSTAIVSQSVKRSLYEEFSFGNAAFSTLELVVLADDVPKGSTIKRFVRLVNGDQASEWLPSGVFFTNRRSEFAGCWTIEAFDVLRKAEMVWVPDEELEFPMSMVDAVNEFCAILDCELDPRTKINPAYSIDYPANDDTVRQILAYIAAAHVGNWIVTGEGKLLLVPLLSIPPETNYLVTEYGRAITLGGVRILV